MLNTVAYPTPHWTNDVTGKIIQSSPALYTSGDRVQTATIFNVIGGGSFPVVIKGVVSGGNTSFTLWATNSPYGAILTADTIADAVLTANTVDCYNPMKIKWYFGDTNKQNFLYIGQSTNQVYVTWHTPISGTPLFHTVVHLACSKTGATTESQAAAKTWSLFSTGSSPKDVTTWNGRLLHYYEAGIPWAAYLVNGSLQQNTEVGQLLNFGNGQCNSWRELLESAWGVNGIASQKAEARSTTSNGFLVRKWSFGTASLSAPYDYYLELNQPDGTMVPSISGDIQNKTGIPGQNSPTPVEKVFGVHYFQKFNNRYYDPSYGVNYTNNVDFQSKAVEGYLIPTMSRTPGKFAVAVKPVTNTIEIQIIP